MPTRFEDQPWYPKSEVEGSGRARGRCPDGARRHEAGDAGTGSCRPRVRSRACGLSLTCGAVTSLGSEALRNCIAARRTAAYGSGNSGAASEV